MSKGQIIDADFSCQNLLRQFQNEPDHSQPTETDSLFTALLKPTTQFGQLYHVTRPLNSVIFPCASFMLYDTSARLLSFQLDLADQAHLTNTYSSNSFHENLFYQNPFNMSSAVAPTPAPVMSGLSQQQSAKLTKGEIQRGLNKRKPISSFKAIDASRKHKIDGGPKLLTTKQAPGFDRKKEIRQLLLARIANKECLGGAGNGAVEGEVSVCATGPSQSLPPLIIDQNEHINLATDISQPHAEAVILNATSQVLPPPQILVHQDHEDRSFNSLCLPSLMPSNLSSPSACPLSPLTNQQMVMLCSGKFPSHAFCMGAHSRDPSLGSLFPEIRVDLTSVAE
ncbi:hypothetical protein BC830DRAFT_69210 [Chytriomyces sp. MP71]|nr:hypothetical protein BC830DRAFT_69210 [Chytriomyces sp. MP71]